MKGPTALAFTLVRWGSHNQLISLFPAATPSDGVSSSTTSRILLERKHALLGDCCEPWSDGSVVEHYL